MSERGGLGLTLDETGEPTVEDPNHGSGYDASKVGCLVDAVCVGACVEENASYDLGMWMSVKKGWGKSKGYLRGACQKILLVQEGYRYTTAISSKSRK